MKRSHVTLVSDRRFEPVQKPRRDGRHVRRQVSQADRDPGVGVHVGSIGGRERLDTDVAGDGRSPPDARRSAASLGPRASRIFLQRSCFGRAMAASPVFGRRFPFKPSHCCGADQAALHLGSPPGHQRRALLSVLRFSRLPARVDTTFGRQPQCRVGGICGPVHRPGGRHSCKGGERRAALHHGPLAWRYVGSHFRDPRSRQHPRPCPPRGTTLLRQR